MRNKEWAATRDGERAVTRDVEKVVMREEEREVTISWNFLNPSLAINSLISSANKKK